MMQLSSIAILTEKLDEVEVEVGAIMEFFIFPDISRTKVFLSCNIIDYVIISDNREKESCYR